ncbi:hypothetical protein ACIGW3_26150 [Streptomyces sp. NPDC053499]|uniref:hypothetical protein n=1 Tax=Streptomyces sp. NPDC053499 TaxID=3365707 RepID=UPI0037D5A3D3
MTTPARDRIMRHLTATSLCPPPRPEDEATALLDAHAAEVRAAGLREAADEVEQTFIHGVTPAASERDEIWDDAVRAVATLLRQAADRPATENDGCPTDQAPATRRRERDSGCECSNAYDCPHRCWHCKGEGTCATWCHIATFPTDLTRDEGTTRHTADTITDDELDALYAEREQLLAELGGRDEEARERWVQKQLAETGLRAADFRNGMAMEIEPARELVAHWVGAARAMLGDAPNYTETPVSMEVKVGESPERFAFVLQRVGYGALTPHEARQRAEEERDGAYRERAQLLAWLAALVPAVLAPAPDIDEDGWQLLYLDTPAGQLSWHIHPRDTALFGHVEHVPTDDPRAQWDGHTTAEKYERIGRLVADSDLPRDRVQRQERKRLIEKLHAGDYGVNVTVVPDPPHVAAAIRDIRQHGILPRRPDRGSSR